MSSTNCLLQFAYIGLRDCGNERLDRMLESFTTAGKLHEGFDTRYVCTSSLGFVDRLVDQKWFGLWFVVSGGGDVDLVGRMARPKILGLLS